MILFGGQLGKFCLALFLCLAGSFPGNSLAVGLFFFFF